ncbi:MAG: alkaline phosphatase D family protein [Pirellulales bacterium]
MLDLSRIREAARDEGGVSRRLFLAYGAALSAVPFLGTQAIGRTLRRARFESDPFTLGVASGDPAHDGFVIWTRLAPKPLAGGGMPPENIEVRWEVAEDDAMQRIVRSGTSLATPQLAHSVHVEVEGLKPDRWYWYRFQAGDSVSTTGRGRTMPESASLPDQLRFVFASCQHYEQGLFTAYEHMAQEDLDLVVHLGDYIYEGPGQDKRVRKHVGGKLTTLEDYRNRHAQYRSDPLLHGMHARCPWVVTWDDHEFENNYAAEISERQGVDPGEFLEQRANAYQAFYEMMPLRARSIPQGPDMKLYRTISFGRLATFQVLDTRQYRSDQPNGDKGSDLNDDALNPKNSLLGAKQAGWLKRALLRSTAEWNVLAQQVMMGMADVDTGEAKRYSMDQWCSAAYERMKLVQFLAERKIANPVVLTGDIHSNWVNELRVDDRRTDTSVVATEFVGTSLSSGGNGSKEYKQLDLLLAENPCVKFHNRQRGYVSCTVTQKTWRSDYRVVEEVIKPGGAMSTLASFFIETGRPSVLRADA